MDVKRRCFAEYWANVLAIDPAVRRGDEETVLGLLGTLGRAPDWFWALPVSAYPPLLNGDAT